jgi:hypothetical protein
LRLLLLLLLLLLLFLLLGLLDLFLADEGVVVAPRGRGVGAG